MKKTDPREAVIILCIISAAIGFFVACFAFGLACIFLNLLQAVGVGILSFGAGSIYGMTFGSRRIVDAIVKTALESEAAS